MSRKETETLYYAALNLAIGFMALSPDLEPTSALKEAGHELGIPWGAEMGAFVTWAHDHLL